MDFMRLLFASLRSGGVRSRPCRSPTPRGNCLSERRAAGREWFPARFSLLASLGWAGLLASGSSFSHALPATRSGGREQPSCESSPDTVAGAAPAFHRLPVHLIRAELVKNCAEFIPTSLLSLS